MSLIIRLRTKTFFMKHTTPKKSMADFKKNAIISNDQLLKIKGGTTSIIVEELIP